MIYMILSPREISIVQDPHTLTDGPNAPILRVVREKLNAINGDMELTDGELAQVKQAERNWRFGYQRQFQVVLQAAERHANDN